MEALKDYEPYTFYNDRFDLTAKNLKQGTWDAPNDYFDCLAKFRAKVGQTSTMASVAGRVFFTQIPYHKVLQLEHQSPEKLGFRLYGGELRYSPSTGGYDPSDYVYWGRCEKVE
jgi:hypothetical protein